MNYLTKFDSNGKRITSYPLDDTITDERYAELIGEGLIELVNPVIVKTSGKQVGSEGCLSVPDRFEEVERPMTVTVRAQDRNGNNFTITAEGFKARALCHEIDHLDGILYIDRLKNKNIPKNKR